MFAQQVTRLLGEVVEVASERSAPGLPDVHPEVALGEAQERLERAYTFGSDADIAQARMAVEEARSRVGSEVASRHATLIRETAERLTALGETGDDVSKPAMTELASRMITDVERWLRGELTVRDRGEVVAAPSADLDVPELGVAGYAGFVEIEASVDIQAGTADIDCLFATDEQGGPTRSVGIVVTSPDGTTVSGRVDDSGVATLTGVHLTDASPSDLVFTFSYQAAKATRGAQ